MDSQLLDKILKEDMISLDVSDLEEELQKTDLEGKMENHNLSTITYSNKKLFIKEVMDSPPINHNNKQPHRNITMTLCFATIFYFKSAYFQNR